MNKLIAYTITMALGLLIFALSSLFFHNVSARVIEHTFHVEEVSLDRLCKKQVVTTVNGSIPGPTIYAEEGDFLVVHVVNNSPYNMTIHWHGIRQYRSCWYDGTESVTQCPITPSNSFTYRFSVEGHEGTFWWHAHSGFQRTNVHGALIVYPRGRLYPFAKPYEDFPIILGEWYNQNVVELEQQLVLTGNGPNASNAFTINGWPGDMYSCSQNVRKILKMPRRLKNSTLKLPSDVTNSTSEIFKLRVIPGKTYLLRIINAALDTNHFFKIANHNLTIVATDGIYTNPYHSPLAVIAPGQTLDVLFTADQPPGRYYMVSLLYRTAKSSENEPNTIPSTGIIEYVNFDILQLLPKMPNLPDIYDSVTSFNFFNNLTGMVTGKFYTQVPQTIDEYMFVTVGLGLIRCEFENPNISCQAPLNQRIGSSLNNVSFALPVNKTSILEAFVSEVEGIYTNDFPDQPPVRFDYVNESFRLDESLVFTEVSTKVKQFKFNASVEIVFQTHALVAIESHPMHIHGHNVHVLGQGYGNYDSLKDRKHLNFVNPQMRNTIYVPIGGWVVIRFRADNPGAWYIHCHIEGHVPIGLAGAFLVENGPTQSTSLGPPPIDLPKC